MDGGVMRGHGVVFVFLRRARWPKTTHQYLKVQRGKQDDRIDFSRDSRY
jgi:hypothetical protein